METSEMATTFVIMVRGEADILRANLLHHMRLNFDQYIVLSHVEHANTRSIVDEMRNISRRKNFVFVEIDDPQEFSTRKANYINHAIALAIDSKKKNIVFCADADEFLFLGRFREIRDLSECYLHTHPLDSPLYLTLPWVDLLPVDNAGREPSGLAEDAILDNEYIALADSGWNGTKVIFEQTPDTAVHMGYHWLEEKASGNRIHSSKASNIFVETEGLCVYHIPFRNFDQFLDRMANYAQSADSTAKYNILGAIIASRSEVPSLRTIFDWCIAEKPRFIGLEELASDFGLKRDGSLAADRLETIAKFLTAERRYVGRVLRPA